MAATDKDAGHVSIAGMPGDVRPVPDPTRLTTDIIHREIAALREILDATRDLLRNELVAVKAIIETRFEAHDLATQVLSESTDRMRDRFDEKIVALRQIIETRMAGNDSAIKLLQDGADKTPERLREMVAALRDITDQKFLELASTHGEKFNSIQTQFRERDVRAEQSNKDAKVAVDAALQAAKDLGADQNKSSALAIGKSEAAITKQMDQLGALIASVTKASDEKIADVKDRLTRIEGKGQGLGIAWAALGAILGGLISLAGVLAAFR
jgi:hypothetical protein